MTQLTVVAAGWSVAAGGLAGVAEAGGYAVDGQQ